MKIFNVNKNKILLCTHSIFYYVELYINIFLALIEREKKKERIIVVRNCTKVISSKVTILCTRTFYYNFMKYFIQEHIFIKWLDEKIWKISIHTYLCISMYIALCYFTVFNYVHMYIFCRFCWYNNNAIKCEIRSNREIKYRGVKNHDQPLYCEFCCRATKCYGAMQMPLHKIWTKNKCYMHIHTRWKICSCHAAIRLRTGG